MLFSNENRLHSNANKVLKIPLIIFIGVVFCSVAYALPEANETYFDQQDRVMNGAVGRFVSDVVSDKSTFLSGFLIEMGMFLTFLGLVIEVVKWARVKSDLYDLLAYICFAALVWSAFQFFDEGTRQLWGLSDRLVASIQIIATGNQDPFFISSDLLRLLNSIDIKGADIFDSLQIIAQSIAFFLISGLLKLTTVIVQAWSSWGYAFSKIIGYIAFFMILTEWTRPYFSAAFKIFMGFWFFNLAGKIMIILYYVYFSAAIQEMIVFEDTITVGANNVINPFRFVMDVVEDRLAVMDFILHSAIGIFFMLAAVGASGMLAQGFDGGSGAASRGILMLGNALRGKAKVTDDNDQDKKKGKK